jgi:formylglycine-generating enzyme required for sulfatase activity
MREPNKGYPWGVEERPQHEVHISKGYYMGVYEVTQGEYTRIMGSNPSWFAARGKGRDQVKGMDTRRSPVESVHWHDAALFCKKLSERPEEKKAGRVYRLPTDAEWEYACRAGTTTLFHYGNTLSYREANFEGMSPFGNVEKRPGIKRPKPVGSYKPNAWGLYDMHGNVWEWCLDGPRFYTFDPVRDPRGPAPMFHPFRICEGAIGAQIEITRIWLSPVMRGGSWREGAVRSAFRKARDYAMPINGFRVLCEQK